MLLFQSLICFILLFSCSNNQTILLFFFLLIFFFKRFSANLLLFNYLLLRFLFQALFPLPFLPKFLLNLILGLFPSFKQLSLLFFFFNSSLFLNPILFLFLFEILFYLHFFSFASSIPVIFWSLLF